MTPLYAARIAVLEGRTTYEIETCKAQARIALYLGDLDRAIYNTRVALYIARLIRVGATPANGWAGS